MFNNDTLKLNKILNPQTVEPQNFNQVPKNNELEAETNYFSKLEETITQDGTKRINLDVLSDSAKYSINEYFELLNNPEVEKKDLFVLDYGDGEDDDAIIKKSVENLAQVCDLVEKFQDEPDNKMVQYINKCIEVNGEDFLSNISFEQKDGKREMTITDGENFISFDIENANMTNCSAAGPWGIIPGTIIDIFDGNSKDGQIEDTEQGATGDCWLLSGINALSYTEEGKEIIKNALEYHDAYTVVHLATGDYLIDDSEVATTKGSTQYSSGDDDMIILELAIEKALDEIANGDVVLTEDAPWYLANDKDGNGNRESTSVGNSSTEGGWQAELWYLLTGKASVGSISGDENIKNVLDEFEKNNGKDIALACIINSNSLGDKEVEGLDKKNGSYYITDANGNEHKLGQGHAYAVKSVDGDTVVVTNPWDSGKEIVLTREQYIALFDYNQKIDLSDNNKEKDFVSYEVEDENGETKNYDDRRIKYDDKGKVDWIAYDDVDENGKPMTAFDTDNDGVIDQYYINGEYVMAKSAEEKIDEQIEKTTSNHKNKKVVDRQEMDNSKMSFPTPSNEEFECSQMVTFEDKETGETIVQYFDNKGNLRQESVKDENGKVVSSSSYKEGGKVKIMAQYEMLEDEQGEYYGVARYVVQDLDENGDWKNHVPLQEEQYRNIEERKLFEYSQFDGADVAFLAMYDDETWVTIEKYLEEHPDASFREIQIFVGK